MRYRYFCRLHRAILSHWFNYSFNMRSILKLVLQKQRTMRVKAKRFTFRVWRMYRVKVQRINEKIRAFCRTKSRMKLEDLFYLWQMRVEQSNNSKDCVGVSPINTSLQEISDLRASLRGEQQKVELLEFKVSEWELRRHSNEQE
uniref:Uncharacterized protein n=1 Tax=Cryptomonas curvata TaxID=233186 RepID=A0A7S0M234_9CRYP